MKNTVDKKKERKSRKKVKKQWLCETPLLKVHMTPSRDLVKMHILIHQVWAWDLQFCTSNKLSGDTGAAGPALMTEQGTLRPRILHWHKEEICYHCRELSPTQATYRSKQTLKVMRRNRNTGKAPRPAQDGGWTRRTGKPPTWPQHWLECGGSAESWGQSLDGEKNSLAHQATH